MEYRLTNTLLPLMKMAYPPFFADDLSILAYPVIVWPGGIILIAIYLITGVISLRKMKINEPVPGLKIHGLLSPALCPVMATVC